MENLEHPDITSALRTGYPSWELHHDPRICPMCGETPIDNESYEVYGEEVCEKCMIKLAVDIFEQEPEDAAKYIGAVRRFSI